jgi:hypothetical protein
MLLAGIRSLFFHILGYDKRKDRIHIRLHDLAKTGFGTCCSFFFYVCPIQRHKMAMFLEKQLYLAWHTMAYAGYGMNVMTFLSMGVHFLSSMLASKRPFSDTSVYCR